ncbi:hypothetical protein QBC46DRAFT_162117 [Diplogelasinospora grovesii]|uniref:RING-type E3 ubiquitin transferase n=1 Tax=Diplogelasinospora grovesii TaxID=303347 RepID=A0AAN6N3X1_9PEZI|nr:hypothetical protein QBC46DRAFT_162117 [Diplogelasinospora grovesii]
MSDTTARDMVYCHECHHEWQRGGDGIECPACRSTITEIVREGHLLAESRAQLTQHQITSEHDPRHFHNRAPAPAVDASESSAPATATSELATNERGVNAPPAGSEVGDAQQSGGSAETASQPQTPGNAANTGSAPHSPRVPAFRSMISPGATFFTIVTEDVPMPQAGGGEGNGTNPPSPRMTFYGMQFIATPRMQVSPSALSPTATTSPTTGAANAEPATNTAEQPAQTESNQQQQDGFAATTPPHPATEQQLQTLAAALSAMLASLFNNTTAAMFGDYVHTQEALDRLMAQLAEQHAQNSGAPPASQSAIDKLEVKEIDDMLLGPGDDRSKCVICVDDMVRGDMATVLPCKHFFHGECVSPWLKQHRTCPVCRKSIEEDKPAKPAKVVENEHAHHHHHHQHEHEHQQQGF